LLREIFVRRRRCSLRRFCSHGYWRRLVCCWRQQRTCPWRLLRTFSSLLQAWILIERRRRSLCRFCSRGYWRRLVGCLGRLRGAWVFLGRNHGSLRCCCSHGSQRQRHNLHRYCSRGYRRRICYSPDAALYLQKVRIFLRTGDVKTFLNPLFSKRFFSTVLNEEAKAMALIVQSIYKFCSWKAIDLSF
jgi:hypothetical protein